MRTRPLAASVLAALAVFALAGCGGNGGDAAGGASQAPTASATPTPTWTPGQECAGVEIKIQFGLLGAPDLDDCAPVTAASTVSQLLTTLGVTTAGTAQYGDQVLCRVDGLPSATKAIDVPGHSAYTEKCAGMPAAFAYWALWLKPSASGTWGYAEAGVTTQKVSPGQIVGLTFTTGTDTTPPQN